MTDADDSTESRYKASSFSATGNCVEVDLTRRDDLVAVRNSRRKDEPPLLFERAEWAAFVSGVKAGEFDPA
ncbi:DUF397 domain-containing protein [Actinomycetes bacterium KLBMP 9759]